MRIVHRYDLASGLMAAPPAVADTTLTLPKGAVVRWVLARRDDTVTSPHYTQIGSIYIECDPAQTTTEKRLFRMVPLDVPFDDSGSTYVGSLQMLDSYSGHVYEITKAAK
jgi:hypothetical protein